MSPSTGRKLDKFLHPNLLYMFLLKQKGGFKSFMIFHMSYVGERDNTGSQISWLVAEIWKTILMWSDLIWPNRPISGHIDMNKLPAVKEPHPPNRQVDWNVRADVIGIISIYLYLLFFLPDTGRCCHQGSRRWKRTWKRNLVIDGSKVKAFIISVCWFSFTFSTKKKADNHPQRISGSVRGLWGSCGTDMFRVGCLVSHSVLRLCSWKPGLLLFIFLNLHLLSLNSWFKCRHALTHSSCTFCLLTCQNSFYFHAWPPGGSHAPTGSAWTNRPEKRRLGCFRLSSSCCRSSSVQQLLYLSYSSHIFLITTAGGMKKAMFLSRFIRTRVKGHVTGRPIFFFYH